MLLMQGKQTNKGRYSWGHLVVPNTEELISRPFLDENSIRQLFWDRVNPWPATGGLALLQLQLCLQLQQNTMVPVDVDGQICHFCSQVFVPCWYRLGSLSFLTSTTSTFNSDFIKLKLVSQFLRCLTLSRDTNRVKIWNVTSSACNGYPAVQHGYLKALERSIQPC